LHARRSGSAISSAGEIRNPHHPRPLLQKLDSIECRDALLAPDGKGGFVEAEWPEADFIVGNPPFLGDRKMIFGLGENIVFELRNLYSDRVPGSSDLVCYWLQKGLDAINRGRASSVGFVATNSVRGGNNLAVMKNIAESARIFEAWSDEGWTVDGAAVRVSIICYSKIDSGPARLDGTLVHAVNADLTSDQTVIHASRLSENGEASFIGTQKNGPFEIPRSVAVAMLQAPLNANTRPNSDVVRPWINGIDIVRRPTETWIIDFGLKMSGSEAALYEEPFDFVAKKVKPTRKNVRRSWHRNHWWLHGDPRPALRAAVSGNQRFVATCIHAKHRLFVWLTGSQIPEHSVAVVAREDDTTLGILHSRFHEAWSLRLGTSLEDRPRYTPTTTFETFPFPEGLTPNIPAADYADDLRAQRIAAAAKRLDDLRRAWLNPPDLVDIVPEITPTAAPGETPRRYPDRVLPKNAEAAVKLKTRTLTNLYNERPRWLADAHDALDRAVAAAYGWREDIATEEALGRLLSLNFERAKAGASGEK
jgi:type II restriction/modification system DNA methylase subunit YeeA